MRDCKHGRLARSCEVCDLEQQVQVLTEALDTAVGMLHGFEEHVAASWAPHADYLFRQALADLDAALAAADQTDEGDK